MAAVVNQILRRLRHLTDLQEFTVLAVLRSGTKSALSVVNVDHNQHLLPLEAQPGTVVAY